MSEVKISIGVCLGKHDEDIVAWFNMLKKNHLPVTTWVCNVINAFVSDQDLDIGTVHIETKEVRAEPQKQQMSLMFGSGSSLMDKPESAKGKKGWTVKGSNGEYIIGSTIPLHIYNEQASFALKQMKKNGMSYSSFTKAVIRKYLKTGPKTIPPSSEKKKGQDELLLNTVDRASLKLKTEEPSENTIEGKVKEVSITHPDSKSLSEPTQTNGGEERRSGKSPRRPKPKEKPSVSEPETKPLNMEPEAEPIKKDPPQDKPKKGSGRPNPLLGLIR